MREQPVITPPLAQQAGKAKAQEQPRSRSAYRRRQQTRQQGKPYADNAGEQANAYRPASLLFIVRRNQHRHAKRHHPDKKRACEQARNALESVHGKQLVVGVQAQAECGQHA